MGYGLTVPLLSPPCLGLGQLHVGSQVFRRERIYDENGELTDALVVGTLTGPDGIPVDMTVTNESVGVYLVTFPVFAERGIYDWRIEAQGPVYQVEVGTLRVDD